MRAHKRPSKPNYTIPKTPSFFGVFRYHDMETESCAHHIYFQGVTLDQPLGSLPKGWTCVDAYLNLKDNTISFVKSWKSANPSDPNCGGLVEDEYYEFPMAELTPLFWKG